MKVKLTLNLEPEVIKLAKQLAKANGITLSSLFIQIVHSLHSAEAEQALKRKLSRHL